MSVHDEIIRQQEAEVIVKFLLSNGKAWKPETLIKACRPCSDYIVRRAVWSLIADGLARLTDENEVETTYGKQR